MQPTNWEFRQLLLYRMYRLHAGHNRYRRSEYSRVKKNTTYLQVGLGPTMSTGDDPIRILDFLAQYVTQAELLDMTDREAYITSPNFLGKRSAILRRSYRFHPIGGYVLVAVRR